MLPISHPLFGSVTLNKTGKDRCVAIEAAFVKLLDCIEANVGHGLHLAGGRELAIVRTKLEEASFFAKKAVATNPLNQE